MLFPYLHKKNMYTKFIPDSNFNRKPSILIKFELFDYLDHKIDFPMINNRL